MVGERDRLTFIDVARGWALVLMVVNHTARYWIDDSLGAARTALIHLTTTLAGPSFLFLVGFVLPLSWAQTRHRVARYAVRAAQLVLAGYFLNAVVFPAQPLLASNVLHTIAGDPLHHGCHRGRNSMALSDRTGSGGARSAGSPSGSR